MSMQPGTAFITGATSGIGEIYADRLARRGYDLVLVGRNADKLAAMAQDLSTTYRVKVDPLVADLGESLDLPIDLCRSDADAARIERGVAPAEDDQPIMLRQLGPVTMTPHIGEMAEVGVVIFRAVRIIPETHRHAGERPGTHQFPGGPANRTAFGIEDVDRHAEPAGLQLAAVDRCIGIA